MSFAKLTALLTHLAAFFADRRPNSRTVRIVPKPIIETMCVLLLLSASRAFAQAPPPEKSFEGANHLKIEVKEVESGSARATSASECVAIMQSFPSPCGGRAQRSNYGPGRGAGATAP
jgi:hypothetical protein